MKLLVTGGAGYVGATLVPMLLQAGHRVRVLDSLLHGGESLLPVWQHPQFEFIRADLRDVNAVRQAVAGMEGVVHLAAIVGDPACARAPELARAVNYDASACLLEECRRQGVRRLVFASTCSNYGRMSDPDGFVDETAPLNPLSVYAETKVAVEQLLLRGSNGYDPGAVVLRFATVFGVSPRMRFDLTVNRFTAELLLKRRLCVYGAEFWRPYVHVRDAARAMCAVLSAPDAAVRGRHFNVGSTEQNYRKRELVELIRPYAPEAAVEFVETSGGPDPRDYRVSFERIHDELGYRVESTVPDGIREVAALIQGRIVTDMDAPRYRN